MSLKTSQVETLLTPAEIPVFLPAGVYTVNFHQPLSALGTAAATVVTWTPGHRFQILSVTARTAVAGTGTAASQVFNTEISGVATSGGVLTLTLANQQTTYGQNVAATAITQDNTSTGEPTDTVVIALAASGTAFTAGAVDLLVQVQNLDG